VELIYGYRFFDVPVPLFGAPALNVRCQYRGQDALLSAELVQRRREVFHGPRKLALYDANGKGIENDKKQAA